MKLIEINKTFERYILESKFSGMKFEILYYPEREFVSYWIVSRENSTGSNKKLLTKKDILKEAESSAKSGYLNSEEGIKVKNTLLLIAEKF